MKMLLLLFLPCFTLAQSVESVTENYLDASGGIETWRNISSCRQQSDVWQNLDYYNLKPGIVSTIGNMKPTRHNSIRKLPNLEYEHMLMPDGSTTTLFQNDKRSGMLTVGLFFDNPEPNDFTVIAMPQNILTLRDNNLLKYEGQYTIDNITCHVLSGPYNVKSTTYVKFYFDTVTHLLVAIIHDNDARKRITYFKDYKDVNGLQISFTQESQIDNILYFKQLTHELEFNPPIDNAVFYYKKKSTNGTALPLPKHTVSKPAYTDTNLNTFIKSQYPGTRVFIDLWATWCAPCKIEFKKYDSAFYNTLTKFNTRLAFVSIDKKEKRKAWETEIETLLLQGDHFLAGPILLKSIKDLVYQNNTVVIPRYVLIDESGKILATDFLRPSHPQFKREFEHILEK